MTYETITSLTDEALRNLLDSAQVLNGNAAWQFISQWHLRERIEESKNRLRSLPATESLLISEAQTVWKEAELMHEQASYLIQAIRAELEQRDIERLAKKGTV